MQLSIGSSGLFTLFLASGACAAAAACVCRRCKRQRQLQGVRGALGSHAALAAAHLFLHGWTGWRFEAQTCGYGCTAVMLDGTCAGVHACITALPTWPSMYVMLAKVMLLWLATCDKLLAYLVMLEQVHCRLPSPRSCDDGAAAECRRDDCSGHCGRTCRHSPGAEGVMTVKGSAS